jgi:hypothetical protein
MEFHGLKHIATLPPGMADRQGIRLFPHLKHQGAMLATTSKEPQPVVSRRPLRVKTCVDFFRDRA